MKIKNLSIHNFRGIRDLALSDLGTMIVIAGQNGSGKSCIFDAIRLLKSIYGGYQQNEWQQWMGEFQIQITNRASDYAPMFNNPSDSLRIIADFAFSAAELKYIADNADDLLRETVWRTLLPEAYEWGGIRMAAFAAQFRDRESEVTERANKLRPQLFSELAIGNVRAECEIPVNETPRILYSIVLEIVFSNFRPDHIGVIDYHGAQRNYSRENVQGINLNISASEQQRRQSALYNYTAKYNNVKSEMAASYIKELLAEQAGVPRSEQASLTNTLKDLFQTFFTEKEFLGPQPKPDGTLRFPVRVAGNIHDLDELSAGEKEIIYGYLRIRNSTPKNSIILLDEPELHLNPRLIRGLPQFYHSKLGVELGNQMWLVTHSDALLREVVARDGYNVFHMLSCSSVPEGDGQLHPLNASADLEIALTDLVGDLAAYRPGGKVVIFEGGGDSDFDQHLTASLFPDLQAQANLLSGSNRAKVQTLHQILERASRQGKLPFTFFAIADHDSVVEKNSSVNLHYWDAYHIENYLIEPSFIAKVMESLRVAQVPSEDIIMEELRDCARHTMSNLIRHELSEFANGVLLKCINLRTDVAKEDVVSELEDVISKSLSNIQSQVKNELGLAKLQQKETELRTKFNSNLADGTWKLTFRGRDILRRFAGLRTPSIKYEVFRNLLISQMRDSGFQPKGMKTIVDKILAAP